ncbi:MAG: hypothetical protein ACRCW2_05710 [Cellulosilyticaceae bacterium]
MKWLKDVAISFCIWFTIILLGIIAIETLARGELSKDYQNVLVCFLWTAIGVGTVAIYPLFEKLPTLLMIILQYFIAITLILFTVKLGNWSESPVQWKRYWDALWSSTLFYTLGAGVFYIQQRRSVIKQNQVLEAIKALHQQKRR